MATAYQLQKEWRASGVNVGVHTVKNRLNQLGCKNVTTKKKPPLTKAMQKKRLEFCQKYQNWTQDDWKKVINAFCSI